MGGLPAQELPDLFFGFDCSFDFFACEVELISELWGTFDHIFQ